MTDWDLSDDALCECGVRLGDHPPLPKPKPFETWQSKQSPYSSDRIAVVSRNAANSPWKKMPVVPKEPERRKRRGHRDWPPLTANQRAVIAAHRKYHGEQTAMLRALAFDKNQMRKSIRRLQVRGLL